MGKKKSKKLSARQLRQNILVCAVMLLAAIIILIVGIQGIQRAMGYTEESSGERSLPQQVIHIPSVEESKENSGREESSEPLVVSRPESSEESSVEQESSAEESSEWLESSQEESKEESQESQAPVTEDYFRDAVFIGNSLTEGLFFYTDMGDWADGYYSTGLNVSSAQTEAFVDDTYTLDQVLAGKDYGKAYVMMGLNEIGWPDLEIFISEYESLLKQIERNCPGAAIYVQSIMPVSAARSAEGDSVNNENILKMNEMIKAMAQSNGWTYLNVWEAVANEDGVLDADATPDGIHFGTYYMEKWIDYLKEHATV